MDFPYVLRFIKNPEIYKFGIVGTISSLLLLLLTALLTTFVHIFYAYSVIIGFELSLIVGFFLHDKWTFTKVKKSARKMRFLKYNLFSLIGLGINELMLIFLTEQIKLHYLFSELIAIVITFFFNFVVSKKISWKN